MRVLHPQFKSEVLNIIFTATKNAEKDGVVTSFCRWRKFKEAISHLKCPEKWVEVRTIAQHVLEMRLGMMYLLNFKRQASRVFMECSG